MFSTSSFVLPADSISLDAVSSTICFPSSTAFIACRIRELEFFAASALCAASVPTWVATTANPFPASPALAASMEAFKASRFVWEAMSLIVLMIELICCELSLIVSIACTTCCICSLLFVISSPTIFAFSFAALAFWALICTCSDTFMIVLCSSSTELA